MHIINRVTVPTQFTYEPYGTQWRYGDESGKQVCYLQMSRDESNPHWIPFGDLLAYVFSERLEDETFMNQVMESYAIKE